MGDSRPMLVGINTYLPSDEALMISLEGIDAVLYFQVRVAVMKRSGQL
jgi:hypothetical protein